MEQSAGGAVASPDLHHHDSRSSSGKGRSGGRGRGGRHHSRGGGRGGARGGNRADAGSTSNAGADQPNGSARDTAGEVSTAPREDNGRTGGRARGGRGRGRSHHGRGGRGRGRHNHHHEQQQDNNTQQEHEARGATTTISETKETSDHATSSNEGQGDAHCRTGRGGRGGRGRGRSARGGGGRGRTGRGGRGGRGRTNTTTACCYIASFDHNDVHKPGEEHGEQETINTSFVTDINTDKATTSTNAEKEQPQLEQNDANPAAETTRKADAAEDNGTTDQSKIQNSQQPPQHQPSPLLQNNMTLPTTLQPHDDTLPQPATGNATTASQENHQHQDLTQRVPPPALKLPTPPAGLLKKGGPVILLRHSHPPTAMNEEKQPTHDKKEKTKKPTKKKKEKTPKPRKAKKPSQEPNGENDNGYDREEEEDMCNDNKAAPEQEVSAVEALAAMPAKEVSITSDTIIEIKRNENSSSSLQRMADKDATTGSKQGSNKAASSKATTKTKGKISKNGVKEGGITAKAARKFNNDVRACVERSDPDAMREILRNKKNHHFALDKVVLETVMKAYVMAAMFEDALYCLRHCALPGTLSTLHTERILTCLPQNLRNSSAFTAADMINALCIATEFDNPTSRTYFLRIVRGISLEFLEEATSARDRICSAPCERLVRSGLCVVDARFKRGKKPTELVVVPGDQLGVFVPDTMENRGIQAGDAVSILPYAGPYPMSAESLDRNMIEATVINTNPTVIRLQDKTNANLHAMLTEAIEGNVYRIDKLANRMGFNRQLAAAVAVASPLEDIKTRDTRRPCPELIRAITAMDENIDRAMRLSGGFPRGVLTSTAALCSQAIPWSYQDENEETDQDIIRQSSALFLEKYKALEGLNASQSLAVEGAVTNRLTLVQGPPGTGKTAVAIRILQHWGRLAQSSASSGENPSPILATSDSNIAVDNLVEGCAAVGLSVVRLGRPEAIRPELLRFCIDRPPSSYGSNNNASNGSSVMGHKERMKALKNAQVICCTCIGSGGDILDAMTFDRVLVDEATQATEPAVLVPLMRGCRQLVLVGDHCQLPPTVLSTRAEEEGHGVPLFSRMVACGVPPFMLDTQYRMHPCIAMFPSDLFYGGKLRNGVSAPERRPLAGFPWPREEFPVAFYPVKGVEMDDGVSKYNEAEAEAACRAVQALLSGGQCTASDIAVVTPYAAQARLIRRLTRRLLDSAGPPYIEVSSVDGFQGREKEAVVFSAVRSNDYGAIGFTSDWRRVNVSFTRARRALVVIGNDVTLRRGDPDTWGPWLAWADAHGLNMDKPGVPRGRYDPEQLRRVRGGTTAAEMLKDVLARQQAQLKNAEKQLEKAEKKTVGNIMGGPEEDEGLDDNKISDGTVKSLSLEEDLARLENTDGHWDDTDDEDEQGVSQVSSAGGLTSNDVSRVGSDEEDSDAPQDAWDL